MVLECSNCAAPLDIKEGARVVKCAYCGVANQITSMRTISPVRPDGWQPPRTWTPPDHAPMQSVPLRYRSSNRAGLIAAVAITGFCIAGTAIALFASNLMHSQARAAAAAGQAAVAAQRQRAAQVQAQMDQEREKQREEEHSAKAEMASAQRPRPHPAHRARRGPRRVHLSAKFLPYPHNQPDPALRKVIEPALARLRACNEKQPRGYHDDQIYQDWVIRVSKTGKLTDASLGGDAGPPGASRCEKAILRRLDWGPVSDQGRDEFNLRFVPR